MTKLIQRVYKSVYTWIIVLLAIIFLASFLGWNYTTDIEDNNFLSQLLMGTMTSVIGAAIVVFGIDQILRHNKRIRQKPVLKVALKAVDKHINRVTNLIAKMAKASAKKPWKEPPKEFSELLSEDTAEQICYRLNLESKAPVAQRGIDWRTFLFSEFKKFEREINNLIIKYGSYLPEPILAHLEEITSSLIVFWSLQLPTIKNIDQQNNFSRPPAFGPGLEEKIAEDFQNILTLIEEMKLETEKNEIPSPSFPNDIIEREDVTPNIGDSRYEIF